MLIMKAMGMMTDPARILEWWKGLWSIWDIRVLILLSLTLQLLLFVLGNRRKYISSWWINTVVWLAYLLADSVATYVLGKLSQVIPHIDHINVDSNNVWGALWGPLLLLHLGGPDTITAYSLEDNGLWLRHLMGLGVQTTVAGYVIFMTWTNSWLSYLSIPVFVAAILKFGERVWVLRSASNDQSGNIVPFGNLAGVSLYLDHDGGDHHTTTKDKYVKALVMAHKLVRECKRYMENYDPSRFPFKLPASNQPSKKQLVQWRGKSTSDDTYFWDALEIETGLMYDLLYTKASIMYSKRGCVLRSICIVCTTFVSILLFWVITEEKKLMNRRRRDQHYYNNDFMINSIITGVLLVGALALEIYGATLMISSDWALLWLIKHGKGEWVVQLRRKCPWFYQSKKWSRKVGQFDLLGFCMKENCKKPSCLGNILGLLGFEDKFARYMHQSSVAVPPTLYRTVLDYFYYWSNPRGVELDKVAQAVLVSTVKILDPNPPAFYELIIVFHLATEMFYHYETSQGANSSGSDDQIKETCRTLSHYMMYLLLMCPSVLPIAVSETELGVLINDLKGFLRVAEQDVTVAREMLRSYSGTAQEFPQNLHRVVLVTQKYLRNPLGWEGLNSLWLGMLGYAAIKGQKNNHLQQLSKGGDFLTFLWFFIPQSNILDTIDSGKVSRKINNQVTQLIASNIDSYGV